MPGADQRTDQPAPATRWRRVLVFHIGSLGDTVLSVPALAALRAAVGPDATITLLHDDGATGRVAPTEVIPAHLVDRAIAFPAARPAPAWGRLGRLRAEVGRAAALAALVRQLRRTRYDAVVNLALADRTTAARRRDRAFYRLAGIATAVGFEPEAPGRHEADARLARLRRAGLPAALGDGPWIPVDAPAAAAADHWLRTHLDAAATAAVVTVAPGTLMPAKRWPTDRWEELGRRLVGAGLVPVVVGGPADRAEGRALVAAWGGGACAAGDLDPRGSAALAARARLHVGVDTGTTHLAAAVGTPVVALYSHRAPIDQWAPLGTGHRVLHHPVPCAGCLAVECPVAGRPCLTGITVDEAWAAAAGALADDDLAAEDLAAGALADDDLVPASTAEPLVPR